jgi:4-hydroxybenzoate polyprenyltransferase
LLLLCLGVALAVVLALPQRSLCLGLALISLPLVLIYPSAKRWFGFPQLLLALCWGFAVLIPWAAARGSLTGGWPLWGCYGATIFWTFGFDTVYAMADRADDQRLGIRSSALSLRQQVVPVVGISAGMGAGFLLPALLAACGFVREWWLLKRDEQNGKLQSGKHFQRQVLLGALLLFALILGRYPQ